MTETKPPQNGEAKCIYESCAVVALLRGGRRCERVFLHVSEPTQNGEIP